MCDIHVCIFCQKSLCCAGSDWVACDYCGKMVCYDCAVETFPEVWRCPDCVDKNHYELRRARRAIDQEWVEIFWHAGYGVSLDSGRTFYYARMVDDLETGGQIPECYAEGPEITLDQAIASGDLVLTSDPPDSPCPECGKALDIEKLSDNTLYRNCGLCGWESCSQTQS